MSRVPWSRLIRFVSTDGRILRGEPIIPSDATDTFDLGKIGPSDNVKAKIIEGKDIFDTTGNTKVTDQVVEVKQVLGPLVQEEVPIIRCVGLNYAKHSESVML